VSIFIVLHFFITVLCTLLVQFVSIIWQYCIF